MTCGDKPPRPEPSERERKLAEALRANLRRRKAGRDPDAPETARPKSAQDG
jgi:hypothetical protein